MKISARNIFQGKVSAVRIGAVNAEVDFRTAGGDALVAIITNESVHALGLQAGSAAAALVKASSVMVMSEGDGLRLSARNCLQGKVVQLAPGPISAEVGIALPGGDVVHASITQESLRELGIAIGASVTAVFKASSVILAVPA